jgi:adenosylmethionine-8-amino-7-oxononanoate aminotransferase
MTPPPPGGDARSLVELDRALLWHPYSTIVDPPPVFAVTRADGVRLELADGTRLIDGMSSWWSVIHGYNHPRLNAAVEAQLASMAHVMFGGLTHEPAVRLAQRLVEITPAPLSTVFFSDSGSVAVEVALKMAIQYQAARGRPARQKLLTVRGGYHGDTFGAMSVCDPVTGMHTLFNAVLPAQVFAPRPACRFDGEWHESDIAETARLLAAHRDELAAVIIEPVVQGAGGMWFYHPQYLARLRELCDEHEVLLIADEIATGFGRTGRLFACEHAGISPDILCLRCGSSASARRQPRSAIASTNGSVALLSATPPRCAPPRPACWPRSSGRRRRRRRSAGVRGRAARLEAAALVDRDVDHDRTARLASRTSMLARDELRRRGARTSTAPITRSADATSCSIVSR